MVGQLFAPTKGSKWMTVRNREREELLREVKRTDAEIDQKVYELYGLTEEERQTIETSLASKS